MAHPAQAASCTALNTLMCPSELAVCSTHGCDIDLLCLPILSRLLWYLSPALALSVLSETTAQYLLAQSKAVPIMASSLVGLGLSPLLYWGLVFW